MLSALCRYAEKAGMQKKGTGGRKIRTGGGSVLERTVLCGASAYEEKYYFNRQFDSLPESIKEELQILCVLFTEDVGGILTLEYDEDGSLEFKVMAADDDFDYDEIGSGLKIRQYQREKRELLESLELYYKVFFLAGERKQKK